MMNTNTKTYLIIWHINSIVLSKYFADVIYLVYMLGTFPVWMALY